MSYLSSLAGSVTNFTATIIVAIAIHVPFLFSALMSIPYTPPTQPIASSTHAVATTTSNKGSVFGTPLTPAQLAAWQAKNAALQAVKCAGLCVPFDDKNFFTNERLTNDGYVFTGSSTQSIVSLKGSAEPGGNSGNVGYDVYINDSHIGEAGGEFLSQPSFSPNGKYFAFIETDDLGGANFDTMIYVINLLTKQVSFLNTYRLSANGSAKGNPFVETMSYDESYTWDNDNLMVTQYTVQLYPGDGGQYYRTSPVNIWQFNLDNFTSPLPLGTLISSK